MYEYILGYHQLMKFTRIRNLRSMFGVYSSDIGAWGHSMLDLTVKNWGFEGHISVFVDQRLGFEIHHLRFDTYNSALEGGEWQFGQDLGLKAHIIGFRRYFGVWVS